MRKFFAAIVFCCLLLPTLVFAVAPPAPVPRTGQTTSYAVGDDGDLQAGVAWPNPRFTDIGDGTVGDNLTGLIWAKDANAPGPTACSPATTKSWQGALDYVACLNSNSYLGFSDWILPNINELKSLVDTQNFGPALPSGHLFTGVQSAYYWSSSTYAVYSDYAWIVGMGDGYVYVNSGYGYKTGNSYYVWPVRGGLWSSSTLALPRTGQTISYASGDDGALQRGVAWPASRFNDNGDGTVSDTLTGLVWLKMADCLVDQTWFDALSNANTLQSGDCGLSDASVAGDWRLPNREELTSLVDHGQYGPVLPAGHPFTGVQSNFYWSSSTNANYSGGYAWIVYMYGGYVTNGNKTDGNYYVWPVRGGQLSLPLSHLLTVTQSGTGSGSVTLSNGTLNWNANVGTASYPTDTTVTLTATATTGSTFSGWSGACSGSGDCTVTMNAAQSVTATFAAPLDTTPPTITAFTVPSTSNSLTVTGIILTADDVVGVTGYMLTESASPPAASAVGWSSSAPTQYAFDSTGPKTLYAWARDAVGNVSNYATAAVTVTLPDTTVPSISVFRIPTTSSSLAIPIVRFTTDNSDVSGFCLSETNNSSTCSWSASAPTTYTFTSEGSKNLFAWVKNAAGNISANVSAQVTVTIPKETLTVNILGTGGGTVHSSPGQDINCSSGTCTAQFARGSQVTLTFQPNDASIFAGWNGNNYYNDETTAAYLTSAQQVTATFNAVSPAGAITGQVYQLTNSVRVGVPNVVAKVYQSNYSGYSYIDTFIRSAISDANGNYSFPGLPSQSNYVICYFPLQTSSLMPVCYKDIEYYDKYTKTAVTVTAPNTSSQIDQELKLSATVSGKVTAVDTLAGLAGVTVTAYHFDYSNIYMSYTATVTTDAQGNYQLTNLPYGNYLINFGPPSNSNYLSAYYPESSYAKLSVTSPIPITNINMALPVGGIISGKVIDASTGNGIPNISIKTFQATSNQTGGTNITTISDAQGDFRISGLTTNTYKVFFETSSADYFYSQYFNTVENVNNALSASLVSVTAGQEIFNVDFSLNPGGRIAGQLTSTMDDTAEVSGVNVQIYSSDGSYLSSVTTDPFGLFKSSLLSEGYYKVCFQSLNIMGKCYNNKADVTTSDSFGVTKNNTTYIDTAVTQTGSISGRVTTGGLGGVNGVVLSLYDVTGSQLLYQTTSTGTGQLECNYGACGNYSFAGLQPGSYKLYIDAGTTGYGSQWFNTKVDTSSADSVLVTLGATTAANVTLSLTTNGACGSSNGQTLSSAPIANLCTTGTSTTVIGSGPWSWGCNGSASGTNASCSASLYVPPVVAQFAASTTSGSSPVTVSFTDQSTGSPTSWQWDFGDGSTSTLQNPSHSYTFAGTYSVTLSVDGPKGSNILTRTNLITVTADTAAPTIVTFSTPQTSTSLTVTGVTLTANDDSGMISGYLLSESSTKPGANDNGWILPAPTQYTFASEGTKTLYAWAKDAAGNVSPPISATITVTLPNSVLFSDDFNDNSLDPLNWTSIRSANRVSEEDGILKLEANVMDQWGLVTTALFNFDPTQPVTFNRKVLLHHANYLNANFRIRIDQAPGYDFGMFYSDADYPYAPYCSPHGFFIFKNSSNAESYNTALGEVNCSQRQISPAITAVWDQWFDEKIVFTPTSGQFEYFINDVKQADYNVGPVPSLSQYRMSLQITPAGWWTGHYHYFDDLMVTQSSGVDIVSPTINSFTIPSTSNSLIVPITTFTASDNVGISGYLLTETSTAPSSGAESWSAIVPSSYNFSDIVQAVPTSKTLYAWVKDAKGNVSEYASATVTITISDNTAPAISTFTVPSTSNSQTVIGIILTADDATGVAGYCLVEANISSGCTWSASAPTSYLFTSDGSKTLYAFARDATGNISGSASASTTIDTTVPLLSLSMLVDGARTNNPTLNVSGTVVDNNQFATVTINGIATTVTHNIFSQAITLESGVNTITIVASDAAGNSTTITRTVTLDPNAPPLTVTTPADNSATAIAQVTITGSCGDAASVTVKVNSDTPQTVAISSGSYTQAVNLSEEGQNTLTITATNSVGDSASVVRTITYDATAPTLTITIPDADITVPSMPFTISGTVDDALTDVSITMTLNGQTVTPTITGAEFTYQLDVVQGGDYQIVVTATDLAGNTATAIRNVIFKPYADLDSDGETTSADALLALQMAVGKKTVDLKADLAPLVNGVPIPDGKVTAADALVILRKAVGLW